MPLSHVQEHIDLIAKQEQEFLAQRSGVERLGDTIAAFFGSLKWVCMHLVLFSVWIAVNWASIPGIPHFDPAPYSLLSTIVALEAIILASFILMRQARMGRRAEERDHLMLQILLLTEKEMTASLVLNRQIGRELGLDRAVDGTELRELSRHTSIEEVAQTIKETMAEHE